MLHNMSCNCITTNCKQQSTNINQQTTNNKQHPAYYCRAAAMAKPYSPKELQALANKAATMQLVPGGNIAPTTPDRPPPKQPAAKKASAPKQKTVVAARGTVTLMHPTAKVMPQD